MAKNNKLINSLNEIARRNRSQNVATAADQMVPSDICCDCHSTSQNLWIQDISVSMMCS